MKATNTLATLLLPLLMLFDVLILLDIVRGAVADRKSLYLPNGDFLPHVRLAKDLVDRKRYDSRVRPVVNHSQPTKVSFSMSLYQILAINEKMQSVDLNVWVIQKWKDEFLGWNPKKYGMINNTILPYQSIWLPDTYLYNSVVMNREETERYINVVVTTDYWERERGSQIKFMYPALYRTSCRIHIRYFPYDQQNCTMIISSWTSDKGSIDYTAEFDTVNLDNFIPNEEWVIVSFNIRRIEEKFVCCPDPWVLLEASLVVRRKPLYYIVNLVVPTSVITLVAVTGFFTPASTSNERREKLSLGIDSLLAMSILMMMVSEQMPTTSDYVPLFGLFYLSIIFIIFVGTLFTAFILNVHLQKTHNKPIPPLISYIFFHKVAPWLGVRPSTTLLELWIETGVRIRGLDGARHSQSMAAAIRKRTHQHDSKRPILKLNNTSQVDRKVKISNPRKKAMSQYEIQPENGNDDSQRRLLTSEHQNNTLYNNKFGGIPLKPIGTTTGRSISPGSTPRDKKSPTPPPSFLYSVENEADIQRQKSIAARNNWKRIAQRASAKRRDELAMQNSAVSGTSIFHDIPYADVSPGRPPSTADSAASPRFPMPPVTNNQSNFQSQSSFLSNAARNRARSVRLGSTAMPALQLFNLSTAASAAAGLTGGGTAGGTFTNPLANDAAMLDMKLRRRYAHEWEFLATVLDRVLLIIFAGLVVLVTAAMIVVGEAIHFSYNLHEDVVNSQARANSKGAAAPMATASPPHVMTEEMFPPAPLSGYLS
ncbi:neurotransmitter-gated ion-channel ligand binding domain-containing protein [Ditylenchus destructor]|uniref:Neurotransmitter-gated ion-channel ligand binding domain-containing protein n=1 Tax=Ditylenchus destructor TaxID=166010 RepID=A0AAD4MTI1_9BILA|nr:neurotransmitter-gated ion-channel ligand binding domain-containing protein [Ditylenchus destructor]